MSHSPDPWIEEEQLYYKSMSYRQWLAGLAMQAIVEPSDVTGDVGVEAMAAYAFLMADAMIKESEK